ncbi:MAG: FKBP-type peptidyl-prolyl cis-trans isomerase [Eubacterium sp.]|nr:FKBP-type peptidyl-prolyl cis-trans isomerase [Eubacterium sp.]
MKKENRKMAQERRAQQREAEVRKQKAKKVIPIVIVIAVIAVVVIGIIATSGLFGGKKADGSSVSSSSGDIVTTINTESTGNAAGTGDTAAASSDSSASTGTTSQDTASAGASSKETLNKTEGTVVQKGDTVNIDYTGYLKGKAFDGGSTNGAGTDLTLGSGTYIDGFEDQVEGHKVGETFDIQVTFPEDYGVSDLNGQEVTFTVTINGVYQ